MKKDFEKLMELYYKIKEEIRLENKYVYERWKAGGFCIDPDIMSMYPCLEQVIEQIYEINIVIDVQLN